MAESLNLSCPKCGASVFFKCKSLLAGLDIRCLCGNQFYHKVSGELLAAFEPMKIEPLVIKPRRCRSHAEETRRLEHLFAGFIDGLIETELGRIHEYELMQLATDSRPKSV